MRRNASKQRRSKRHGALSVPRSPFDRHRQTEDMDLDRASGEFATETPSAYALAKFLRSGFQTHYCKMWAILAWFLGEFVEDSPHGRLSGEDSRNRTCTHLSELPGPTFALLTAFHSLQRQIYSCLNRESGGSPDLSAHRKGQQETIVRFMAITVKS
jgi:hypothetical protein